MVFVRINDPNRIERDSNNLKYSNSLLNKTIQRHYLSNQIFDHFFLRSFTNAERWDFIEDFFLGSDVDSLLANFKGGVANNIDIVEYLKKKDLTQIDVSTSSSADSNIHIFHPNVERFYNLDNLLTIDDENEIRTLRVSEWLSKDPLAFDKFRKVHKLKINKTVFDLLVAKLKAYHPVYFRDTLGLKARIQFKGYPRPVQAIVPYSTNPVEFYKWWCLNSELVNMSLQEKIRLFDKVFLEKPSVLKIEHKRLIKKE